MSNLGRVRTNRQRKRLLTLTTQPTGYLYAMVEMEDGKQKNCRVHRLVAEAFIPNTDNLPMINHKDGDKTNNHADNLEWCTQSMNMRHAYDHGLVKAHRLTDEEKQHLRDLWKGKPKSEEHRQKIREAWAKKKNPPAPI